nr:MAG TPA: hypothetical protein [Caudoviricetes sp.]
MRKELYKMLRDKLKTVSGGAIKHIDLWNHNVEFIEQEEQWERPAVFVEIATINCAPFQGRGLRGKGLVRLHIVTDWTEGGQDAAWDLSYKIQSTLEGLSGEYFNGMTLVAIDTNHNHEEILESIDSYEVRYLLAE